ncbi:MAG TPA: FAD-binding oxidoreductase [Streptosporangiaceae bacterium]|nr:FAD-binding oxidoreductase [Streptosporangiaceae bacterium]
MSQNDQPRQSVLLAPRTSRRDFLAGAGVAGLAAAGAFAAPQVRLVSATSKPTSADWAALARRLSTRKLLRPGEKGYRQAKQLFEPQFDALQPAGVAYCASPDDVAACLSFVRRFRLPVRVRSGGHSYAGWSSVTGGLIVDVSAMHSVRTINNTIRVGSGTDLMRFYSELAARGLAVPGGSCPTVGIAGLALGGGVGVLSRRYGLTCDNMTAVQIVTADGSVLDCDRTHNSDLYWACRGGGGGNFGVATSFTFRTHHLTELCVFYLSWPWSHAARVIGAWQSWAPHAPDALWSTLHLSGDFGGQPVLSVSGTYVGSQTGLTTHLDDLANRAGVTPTLMSVSQQSYLDAMLLEAGCSTIPIGACHTGTGGQLARVPAFAKSDFFTRPLNKRGMRALLSGIEKLSAIRGAAGGGGSIAFDALGGAVNRVHPAETAFVHRDALFLAQYYTSWKWPGTPSGVASQHRWLRTYYNSLHPHASGQAYLNYIDPGLTGWQQAYYGANYARLKRVKAKYDPGNLFSFPQSIGSA